jgi:hypothetical protein
LARKITIFADANSVGANMKFKFGDAVSFLNETGGGVVNRIDGRGIVYVLTDDGFEIPVSEKELIFSRNFALTSMDNAENTPAPQKVAEMIKPVQEKQKKHPEMPRNVPFDAPVQFWLGFTPNDPGPVFSSNLDFYLINDSAYFAYYHLGYKEGGHYYYLSSGLLEAETKCFVKTFDHTAISKISDIHVQLLLMNQGKYRKKEAIDKLVDLKLVNFSKESYYRENDYFEEKALLFNIITGMTTEIRDEFIIPEAVKEQIVSMDTRSDSLPKKKEPATDTLEVDLHAEALTLEPKQYTPAEILALQLSRFHAAVEETIGKKLRRLVIIHGMGQGTLKMQIRKELQEKYPKFTFQDASFKEYGFGATMVHMIVEKQQ